MKKTDLETVIIKGAATNRGLYIPSRFVKPKERNWPICSTCGHDVDAAEIKNVNSKGCDLWAACHGSQDAVKVEWNVPIRDVSVDSIEDKNIGWCVNRAIRDWRPFDPAHMENVH